MTRLLLPCLLLAAACRGDADAPPPPARQAPAAAAATRSPPPAAALDAVADANDANDADAADAPPEPALPPARRPRDVQGAGQRSARVGEAVTDLQGVVTAVGPNGFWVQDPQPDDDPATSEGLLVRIDPQAVEGGPPEPGDLVALAGRVAEFVPTARKEQLPVTQLDASAVRILARGRPLPEPVRLGRGGRALPARVVCDDAVDGDGTAGAFDPDSDGLDFWESLEGMLVELRDPRACGPTSSLNELWVLADGGEDAGPRTARGGIALLPDDVNPERILLAPLLADVPRVDAGTRLVTAGAPRVRGVVDYAFGNFRVLVTAPVESAGGGMAPESAAPAGPDELLVASFNVENLSPASGAGKFAALGQIIAHALGAPDLLALEEVQDDSGPVPDGVTGAAETLRLLVAAVAAAGGPAYRAADVPPANGADGGQPGGNIRCAFLWREDRGLSLVARPGGDAATPARLLREAGAPRLQPSPAHLAPADPAWEQTRKPLVAEFAWRGRPLFALANHWSSKGGDDPPFGWRQPPVQKTAPQRVAQARCVRAFVDELHAAGAQVLVLGDLNDFWFSEALGVLTAGGALVNLTDRLPEAERYSYVWQGNSQQLDHLLASPALAAACVEARPVHVNCEFAAQVSDHDPVLARFRLP